VAGFNDKQVAALRAPLDRGLVKPSPVKGQDWDYLPFHTVITQANEIFGYGRWSREILACDIVYGPIEREGRRKLGADGPPPILLVVGYLARVRVTVQGPDGGALCTHDAPGYWQAEVHGGPGAVPDFDLAAAGAVTAATKRALKDLGTQFGSTLSDDRDPFGEGRWNFYGGHAPADREPRTDEAGGVPTFSQERPPVSPVSGVHSPAPSGAPPDVAPAAAPPANGGQAPTPAPVPRQEAGEFPAASPPAGPTDRAATETRVRGGLKTLWARTTARMDADQVPPADPRRRDPAVLLPPACFDERLTDGAGQRVKIQSGADVGRITDGALAWLDVQIDNEIRRA